MNSILVSALGVELYFFLYMIAINKDGLIFIGLGVENSDTIFKCKIQLKISP